MMRLVSLCLVLFTVACGPGNNSNSDLLGSSHSAGFNDFDSPISASQDYPIAPDPTLTPGLRCTHPDEHRYPEQIAYCERSVSKSVKDSVIRAYDDQLGFHLSEIDRGKIKVDHYIPLCMGGDNSRVNLWPQYEIVYTRTDPLEERLCQALSRGLITQNESIEQITFAKSNLQDVGTMLQTLDGML